jgi:PKD repeat protein
MAWTFGDGSAASTTTATVNHTYATAGSKTVTVTDRHGNTKKVTQTITLT